MLNKNLTANFLHQQVGSLLLVILMLFAYTNSSSAAEHSGIAIKTATISLQSGTHLLNAQIHYDLSDEAIEALHNGITLTFNVDLSIIEPRGWLWNKHLHTLTLPYQIRYHTLSEIYQVSDVTTNVQHNFSSLSAALHTLGSLNDMPIHGMTTSDSKQTEGMLKAYLNIEALPLPMRPLAYVTSGWYLRSNSFEWPLTP